jgi:CRAL/TRIO domain
MMKKKKKQLSGVEHKKDKNPHHHYHHRHHHEKPPKHPTQDTPPAKDDTSPPTNQEHHKEETILTRSMGTTTNSTPATEDPWSPANVQACAALWNLTDDQMSKLRQVQTLLCENNNNNKNHKKDKDNQKRKKNDNGDAHDNVDSIATHWKNDPFEVVRFCNDFHFNVDLVHSKFCKMIAWRQEHKVDSILQDYSPPPLFRYFPFGVLADLDHDGDPIYIERTGMADTLGLLKRYGKEEMIQQAIWVRELMTRGPWLEQEEKDGEQQQQPSSPPTSSQPRKKRKFKYFTVILDMKGLNRHHLHPSLIPVGQHVTRLVQDNYAGLGKVKRTPIGTITKGSKIAADASRTLAGCVFFLFLCVFIFFLHFDNPQNTTTNNTPLHTTATTIQL